MNEGTLSLPYREKKAFFDSLEEEREPTIGSYVNDGRHIGRIINITSTNNFVVEYINRRNPIVRLLERNSFKLAGN
jgi:hypothetical protein